MTTKHSPYPFHRKIRTQLKSYDIKHWIPIGETPLLLTARGKHLYVLVTFSSRTEADMMMHQLSCFQFIESLYIDNPVPPYRKHFALVYKTQPSNVSIIEAAMIKFYDYNLLDVCDCNF